MRRKSSVLHRLAVRHTGGRCGHKQLRLKAGVRRTRMRDFVVLTGLLFAVGIATGQEALRIEGVVRDTSGSVLPGAQITVDGTLSASAVADGNGQFALASLAPGTYTVRAQLPGFRAQ